MNIFDPPGWTPRQCCGPYSALTMDDLRTCWDELPGYAPILVARHSGTADWAQHADRIVAEDGLLVARLFAPYAKKAQPASRTVRPRAHTPTGQHEPAPAASDGHPPAETDMNDFNLPSWKPQPICGPASALTMHDLRTRWDKLPGHVPILAARHPCSADWAQHADLIVAKDGFLVARLFAPPAKQSQPAPGTVWSPAATIGQPPAPGEARQPSAIPVPPRRNHRKARQ